MIALQKATDAGGFAKLNTAAAHSSRVFRDAAASTGMFEVQQLRLNSATDDYVKKLRAQKMGFREMAKQRKIAAAAYKEQLAMENMTVRQGVGSTRTNKGVYDVLIPNQVSKDLDTASKRLAFMNAELKSGAHQMVNWGKNTQWAGRQLMVGFTMPIAAFGAAAGVMAYQVDKELTRIAKVYDTVAQDSIAVEKELAQVRKDSLATAAESARAYGQSATDTLNVQAELAATGKQGQDLQKGTLEVMRIARLGEVEHQTAIEATIALQSVFRMSNQELTESFDYMNSIENATSLSTADFATAIPVAASAVKAFGGDVKEMGILLTAMKENGIGASEGANALKATMQRLGRPSKQIREEWAPLTGTDITELVDSSDGLVEVFTKIQQATKGLDPDAQRKAFAGLFGSYQVSKMMALTKGMGELQQGIGQVSQAYEISNQSADEWATTAEKEIQRYQNSISGMWDTAFQSMKIELAEIGEPFVELATHIVKGIGAILKAFNDMPDFAKKFVAGGIAVAALAGGVLMLAGLFGNLAGNLLKGVSNLAAYALKLELVDKDTKAAQLATELATHSYLEEGKAIQMLTMQIEAMTAAQREANSVMLRHDPAFAGAPAGASNAAILAHGQKQAQHNQIVASMRDVDSSGNMVYRSNGVEISREQAEIAASNTMRERATEEEKAKNRVIREGVAIEEDRNKAIARRNKMMVASAAFMAVEAGAMTAMMVSDNERVQQAAQIAMIAGFVGPALAAAKPAAVAILTKLKDIRLAMVGATASTGLFTGGLAGAKAALLAMMGPVGWIATGLTALVGVVYMAAKHEREQLAARISDQKELNSLAQDYATTAGVAYNEYKKLQNVMLGINSKKEATDLETDTAYFKEDTEGKKKASAFENLETDADRTAAAMQMFVDLQARAGYTAGRAATTVRALFLASGESADTANAAVEELMSSIGTLQSSDWAGILATKTSELGATLAEGFATGKETETFLKSQANEIAGMFSQAMAEATTPEEGAAAIAEFEKATMSGWEKMWNEYILTSELATSKAKEAGITNAKELAAFYASDDGMAIAAFEDSTFLGMSSDYQAGVSQAKQIHSELVGSYAQDYLNLSKDVDTIDELLADINLKAKSLTFDQAAQEIQKIVALSTTQGARGAEMGDETARLSINAYNAANGFKQGSTKAEALYYWTNQVKVAAGGAANAAGGIGGALSRAVGPARTLAAALRALSGAQIAESVKESVGEMQNTMADTWRDNLSDQLDDEKEANSDYWDAQKDAQSDRFDAQSDALDAQHEREQRGMENAWDAKREALENYWDQRIEKVDEAIKAEEKAEEKRQKMFDAEIARINRLADMANTNIDFNVALNEGNLDEAAKIANTSQAKDTEFVFNREREAGSEKSQKRVDRLGKKSESLGEQKENAMEEFSKREEAAKAHFQKMQEMEKESLQKSQEMKRKSLEKEAELSAEALEKDHQRQKDNLDRVLKTFLAFTPQNKKQLEQHAKDLGLSLKEFGQTVLKPMSMTWGEWFKKNIRDGVINSALEAQSSEAWAALGAKGRQDILRALGFKDGAAFDRFIQTGKLGDATAVDSTPRGFGEENANDPSDSKVSNHEGGLIGGAKNSRKGVAKNYRGQHPSEKMINAQLGEYIVNRDAAKKYGPMLDQINSGNGIGGREGVGGFMGGILMKAMLKGVETGLLKKAKEKKAAKMARQANKVLGGSTGFSGTGFVQGQGGWAKPSVPGFGWSNTHDYRTPVGTPIYALSDGVIADSRAITSGGSPGNGTTTPSGVPYRSYGETIGMRAADGSLFRYAHLSERYVGAGQSVKGGALLGRTGITGNSSGPHLHMDVNGDYNASGYLSSRGIPLRKGTEYVKYDNTMANLHRGESVMTKSITSKLREGVDNFASGPQNRYDVVVQIDGYDKDKRALAREVIREIKREAARAPQSRTAG